MSFEDLHKRVRQDLPLLKRLKKCRKMIGKMCAEGRPPAMSIPVQWYDEDIYISTTIKDAIEGIERLNTLLQKELDKSIG